MIHALFQFQKITNPIAVSEMRPIALCNVIYKIVVKAVGNRMKVVLSDIISDKQSAFLPARLLKDNVLIAYEIGHHLHRKSQGKNGLVALKIDMSKTYDRVEWCFLQVC